MKEESRTLVRKLESCQIEEVCFIEIPLVSETFRV